jgi:hypothetical protein
VKGVHTERSEESQMAWLVTCIVRGREVSPVSEEFSVAVMERTWVDGMVRAFQEAIAHLDFLHPEKIAGTGLQYVGQRDDEGQPVAGAPHADLAHQLHHTQTHQDRARMRCDLQETEIETLHAHLAAA